MDRVLETIVRRARSLVEARAVAILLPTATELEVAEVAGELDPGVCGERLPRLATADLRGVISASRSAARIDAGARPLTFRGSRSAWSPPSTAIGRPRVRRGGRAAAARVRRQRRDRRLDGASRSPRTGCATRSRPPSTSASAGRASSTTTPCRLSARCGWCSPPPCAAGSQEVLRARRRARGRAARRRDPRAAGPDLRAAPGGARRARPRRRDRGADRPAGDRGRVRDRGPCDVAERRAARGRLEPELESTLYRVVQEALTNIVKHARAEQVAFERDARPTARIEVLVRDDGRGLRPAPTPATASACSGCASGSSWRAASSRSSSKPGEGTELRGLGAGPAPSGLEQAALERVADELRALGHPQLLLDVGAVRLDGAHAQVELTRRSRRWYGRARSAAGSRPRARRGRRAGPVGSAASLAPSSGWR